MISERLKYFAQPKRTPPSAGFSLSGAMKFPEALESRMYGNPETILEAKQAQQAKEQQHGRRRILTAKPNWSAARQRAEALFAPAGDLPSSPGIPSNSGQAGNGKDSNL